MQDTMEQTNILLKCNSKFVAGKTITYQLLLRPHKRTFTVTVSEVPAGTLSREVGTEPLFAANVYQKLLEGSVTPCHFPYIMEDLLWEAE